jgi:hypothetical protein
MGVRRAKAAHTHCRHSDMDLGFPRIVIGKVAINPYQTIGGYILGLKFDSDTQFNDMFDGDFEKLYCA